MVNIYGEEDIEGEQSDCVMEQWLGLREESLSEGISKITSGAGTIVGICMGAIIWCTWYTCWSNWLRKLFKDVFSSSILSLLFISNDLALLALLDSCVGRSFLSNCKFLQYVPFWECKMKRG